ncbi:uncharacterized protein LOC144444945 [Glandiceps talaboti]
MGIQGLLPLVKDATEPCNIKKYAGYTVAVDTYCWLHKGAFACAMQLAKGEPTDQYVRYVLKYVNMLLSMKIKPILVFDGCNLPSKKVVEKTRRERRETYLVKGKQFLREGKVSEARDCFTKCINVTSKMALDVMKAARSLGVDCIVAPYEADAQLAYLNKIGIAQCVITEDSDLVAFGCSKIVVKMDLNGNGLEVDNSKLNKIMNMGSRYSFEKFRYMCIAAGCDYLPSLPNIGLKRACKVFKLATHPDVTQVLKRMGQYLKTNLVVPQEYIEGFIQANNTFLYQLTFDPLQKKLVPLNPYPAEVEPNELQYAGKYLSDTLALQLALGNIDVQSMTVMNDFKPNFRKQGHKKTSNQPISIWHDDYRTLGKQPASVVNQEERQSTTGKEVQVAVKTTPWKSTKEPVKKVRTVPKDESYKEDSEVNEKELQSQYSTILKVKKKTPTKTSTPEKKTDPNPHRKRLNKFALKRMSSERREALLTQNSTETSRFFASGTKEHDDSETPTKSLQEDGLYQAMGAVEEEYKSSKTMAEEENDIDNAENDSIENKDIPETKCTETLRNKFKYSKESSVKDSMDGNQNTQVKKKEIADPEEVEVICEKLVRDNRTSQIKDKPTKCTDVRSSCEDRESVSSVKSNYFQNLNHFRWNRKGVKSIQKTTATAYLESLVNTHKPTLINSGDINGQFKHVARSDNNTARDTDVQILDDTTIDCTDGGNESSNSLCTDYSQDSLANVSSLSGVNNCMSSISSPSGQSSWTSSQSQETDDKTSQGTSDSDDEQLPRSLSSINSSQRNLKQTRCPGMSSSQPSTLKATSDFKKLLQPCKVSGLSKTMARKRKSMDENQLQSKQRKLTDMFTPKSMFQKSKSTGIPMSPIKDNKSNIPNERRQVRHLDL